MIMQQWYAATKTRHSYTLTHQFLTDLQRHERFDKVELLFSSNVHVTGSGRGNLNFPVRFAR